MNQEWILPLLCLGSQRLEYEKYTTTNTKETIFDQVEKEHLKVL